MKAKFKKRQGYSTELASNILDGLKPISDLIIVDPKFDTPSRGLERIKSPLSIRNEIVQNPILFLKSMRL